VQPVEQNTILLLFL